MLIRLTKSNSMLTLLLFYFWIFWTKHWPNFWGTRAPQFLPMLRDCLLAPSGVWGHCICYCLCCFLFSLIIFFLFIQTCDVLGITDNILHLSNSVKYMEKDFYMTKPTKPRYPVNTCCQSSVNSSAGSSAMHDRPLFCGCGSKLFSLPIKGWNMWDKKNSYHKLPNTPLAPPTPHPVTT